jgi:ribosome maturation factor RimP
VEHYKEQIIPVVEAMGFKLVELQTQHVKNGLKFILFVYRPAGVALEDCAEISRALSGRLQGMMKEGVEALLEVSSPGVGRVFKSRSEYAVFKGQRVQLNLHGGSVARGVLDDVNEEGIFIDGHLYKYEDVAKGKLIE